MPYAIRNSIILIVLLILAGGAGIGYIYLHQEPKVEELEKERAQIREQLGDADDLFDKLVAVQEHVEILNASWRRRPKTLPKEELSSATNIYLNDIH